MYYMGVCQRMLGAKVGGLHPPPLWNCSIKLWVEHSTFCGVGCPIKLWVEHSTFCGVGCPINSDVIVAGVKARRMVQLSTLELLH